MDFYNHLKSFLGIPKSISDQNVPDNRESFLKSPTRQDDTGEPPHSHHADEYERFGFNIFSSPLEMHRYFEHQMNEIMKSFGMFNQDDSFFGNNEESVFGDNSFNYGPSQFPTLEDFHSKGDRQPGNLRDQYLKPGYEQAKSNGQNKADIDIDGRFDMGDLETVLKGKRPEVQPRTFTFGQSLSTRTIRNADGTVETHRTVTDQQGNQEITITRSQGNKEYTKKIRTDKNGQQEVTENLVNLDEKDKDAFLGNIKPHDKLSESDGNLPPHWFPFDKFFR